MNQPRTWQIPLTLTIAVMVLGLVLATGNGTINQDSLLYIRDSATTIAFRLTYYIGPILILVAFLQAQKSRRNILAICFLCVLVNAATVIIRVFLRRPASYEMRSVMDYVIDIAQYLTDPSILVPLLLLYMVRFRGKFERLRVAAMIVVLLVTAIGIGGYWIHGTLYAIIWTVLTGVECIAIFGAAWCMAFRQVTPHRPPIDVQQIVSLACPRCAAAIQIPAGHGECPHCRLQISISLEEGTCAKCHYPLRGLTGDKCPECGEAIVQAAANPA